MTGCSGRGKSTFCNFLSKSHDFKPEAPGSEMSSGEFGAWGAIAADLTGTQFGTVKDLVGGVTLRIIDLPGYLATQNRTGNDREDLVKDGKMVLDEFAKALMHAKDGIDAIFIALKAAERYSREEELLMEFISVLQLWDHCILLFTHGDKAGKEENQRYQDFHKLIKSPSFPERSPVLYKMLQFVNNRFVIVESVNNKGDQKYYLSKVDELCNAIEVVQSKSGPSIGHPLLKLARKAFEMGQEKLDLREVLDQEREDKIKIQKDLEQSHRERYERDEAYKSLEADLEREKAEREREKADLEREKAELERLKAEQTKNMQQREDLCRALQQAQLGTGDVVEQATAVEVLIHWLEEPQTGPEQVVDILTKLSALTNGDTAEFRRLQLNPGRPGLEPGAQSQAEAVVAERQREDEPRLDATLTSGNAEVPARGRNQMDDRRKRQGRRQQRCHLL